MKTGAGAGWLAGVTINGNVSGANVGERSTVSGNVVNGNVGTGACVGGNVVNGNVGKNARVMGSVGSQFSTNSNGMKHEVESGAVIMGNVRSVIVRKGATVHGKKKGQRQKAKLLGGEEHRDDNIVTVNGKQIQDLPGHLPFGLDAALKKAVEQNAGGQLKIGNIVDDSHTVNGGGGGDQDFIGGNFYGDGTGRIGAGTFIGGNAYDAVVEAGAHVHGNVYDSRVDPGATVDGDIYENGKKIRVGRRGQRKASDPEEESQRSSPRMKEAEGDEADGAEEDEEDSAGAEADGTRAEAGQGMDANVMDADHKGKAGEVAPAIGPQPVPGVPGENLAQLLICPGHHPFCRQPRRAQLPENPSHYQAQNSVLACHQFCRQPPHQLRRGQPDQPPYQPRNRPRRQPLNRAQLVLKEMPAPGIVPGTAAPTPAAAAPSGTQSATPVAAAATSAVINVVSFNMWIPWFKPEHLPMQKTLVDTQLQGVDFFAFQEYYPKGTKLYAKVLDASTYGVIEDSWKQKGEDGLAIAYDKTKWELDADSVQKNVMVTPEAQDKWCDRKVLVASFVRKEGGARVRVANFHGPLFNGAKDFVTGTTKIKNAMSTKKFGGPGVLQILLGDFNDLYDHIDKPDGPNMVWDDTTFAHAFNSVNHPLIRSKIKNFDHIAVAGTALEGGKNAKFKNEKVREGDYSDHPIIKIGIPVKM
eukprot:g7059.t1